MRSQLKIHPDLPAPPVRALTCIATRTGGALHLSYELTGDLDAIAWPAPTASQRIDELWRHTCFEAFVRPGEGEGYAEFNVSPSTQWAAYRFDAYRAGMRPLEVAAPLVVVERNSDLFSLTATFDLQDTARDWTVGLSAVIEDIDGVKSYWALRHPPGKPDFHHADGFAARLEKP